MTPGLFEAPLHLWYLGGVLVIGLLVLRSRLRARAEITRRPALAATLHGMDGLRIACAAAVLVALVLLVVASAGPGAHQTADAPLLVAVDVSASMGARDTGESRLQAALSLLRGVLPQLRGRAVGLLLFAGEARLVAPLTADLGAIELMASGIEPGALSPPGTDLGALLDEALHSYPNGIQPDLLLLSDGEETEGETAASLGAARRARMRVYAVGFGTQSGASIPTEDPAAPERRDRRGRVVITRLAESTLRGLADATGGSYLRWEGDATANRLATLLRRGTGPSRGSFARDLLVALAFLLLAAEVGLVAWPFRLRFRVVRKATPFALLLFAPALAEGQTAWLDARRGAAAYARGRFDEAAAAYARATERGPAAWEAWFGLGCAQLRAGHLPEALASFTSASARVSGDAEAAAVLYNRGEGLVRLDRLEEAAEAYRSALRRAPDENARHNLGVVLDRLRQRQPPSPSTMTDQPSASAAPAAPREELSDEAAERLLREAERRQRSARPRPGDRSPLPPETDKDW